MPQRVLQRFLRTKKLWWFQNFAQLEIAGFFSSQITNVFHNLRAGKRSPWSFIFKSNARPVFLFPISLSHFVLFLLLKRTILCVFFNKYLQRLHWQKVLKFMFSSFPVNKNPSHISDFQCFLPPPPSIVLHSYPKYEVRSFIWCSKINGKWSWLSCIFYPLSLVKKYLSKW